MNPISFYSVKRISAKANISIISQNTLSFVNEYAKKYCEDLISNILLFLETPKIRREDVLRISKGNLELQNWEPLIPKATIAKFIKNIITEKQQKPIKFENLSIQMIHKSLENFLIEVFEDANKCAIFDGRETVKNKDFLLVEHIRKDF